MKRLMIVATIALGAVVLLIAALIALWNAHKTPSPPPPPPQIAQPEIKINIYNNGPGSLDVATDASAAASLSGDATHGDPTPGSLRLDAPFHAYKEYVDIQKSYGTSALQNWTRCCVQE